MLSVMCLAIDAYKISQELSQLSILFEPVHGISNNVVCATS